MRRQGVAGDAGVALAVASSAAVPKMPLQTTCGCGSHGGDGSVRASEGTGATEPAMRCRGPNAKCRDAGCRVSSAEWRDAEIPRSRVPRCRMPWAAGRVPSAEMPNASGRGPNARTGNRWRRGDVADCCLAIESEATRPVVREERRPRSRSGGVCRRSRGGCRRSCVVRRKSWRPPAKSVKRHVNQKHTSTLSRR